MTLGCGEVHLNLYSWLLNWKVHLRIDDTVYPREDLPQLLRFSAKDIRVLAVEAHGNVLICLCEYVSDSLFRVGDHLTGESRGAVNHVPKGAHRIVIVGRGIDADPNLAGVDADDLVRGHGAANVPADVPDARDRLQFAGGRASDPAHL